MRIALFHNASLLGRAVATPIVADRRDELLVVSPRQASADAALQAHLERLGIEHLTTSGVRERAFVSRLSAFAPDLLLVATFPWRLPRSVRALARLGAINLHPSLLPRYRGALPEFWVIRDGERDSGLTAHLMDDGFDTGPILDATRVAIAPDDTLLTLTERMCAAAPELVARVLEAYRDGRPPSPRAQDERLATTTPRVVDTHLAIDWRESAASLERLVRAAWPLFEAHTFAAGRRLHVAAVRSATGARPLAPGELAIEPGDPLPRILVGTGDGALEITAGDRCELESAAARGLRLTDV